MDRFVTPDGRLVIEEKPVATVKTPEEFFESTSSTS
jgi:hypothetical protein